MAKSVGSGRITCFRVTCGPRLEDGRTGRRLAERGGREADHLVAEDAALDRQAADVAEHLLGVATMLAQQLERLPRARADEARGC
jgi:hypothetical protein